jgi:hypothetical protein
MELKKLFKIQTRLHDFASIIHRVPASRVRPRLPRGVELETTPGPDGESAFITVGLFRNEKFHWSPFPSPSWDFEQCTYGVFVRHNNQPCIFYFSTLLESSLPSWAERIACRSARLARFETKRHYDSDTGYSDYNVRITNSLAHTRAHLKADQPMRALSPFQNASKMVQYFTERQGQLFEFPGPYLWVQPLRHAEMKPWMGELLYGSFGLWERMGFLTHDEGMKPFCVLVQPEIELSCDLPRPAWSKSDVEGLAPRPV